MGKFIDLTGQKFGNLTIINNSGKDKWGGYLWNCRCSCNNPNNEKVISSRVLIRGKSLSCGCLKIKSNINNLNLANKKHRLPSGDASLNSLYSKYKTQAKKRNILFELSKEDFKELVYSPCFYTEIPPIQIHNGSSCNETISYNGIDRIDSSKGYTLSNVVPCIGWVNLMFNNKTLDQRILYVEQILSHIKDDNIFFKILSKLKELKNKNS